MTMDQDESPCKMKKSKWYSHNESTPSDMENHPNTQPPHFLYNCITFFLNLQLQGATSLFCYNFPLSLLTAPLYTLRTLLRAYQSIHYHVALKAK
jgi:hypothetical protein